LDIFAKNIKAVKRVNEIISQKSLFSGILNTTEVGIHNLALVHKNFSHQIRLHGKYGIPGYIDGGNNGFYGLDVFALSEKMKEIIVGIVGLAVLTVPFLEDILKAIAGNPSFKASRKVIKELKGTKDGELLEEAVDESVEEGAWVAEGSGSIGESGFFAAEEVFYDVLIE